MKSSTIFAVLFCLCIVLLSTAEAKRGGKYRLHNGRTATAVVKDAKDVAGDSGSGSDEAFVSGEDMRDCICNDMLRPVCGSDERTYKNLCVFKCYKKQENDTSLEITSKRACINSNATDINVESKEEGLLGTNIKTSTMTKTKTEQHGCSCSPQYRPVCASDKKSYDNECLMNCKSQKENVKVKYVGLCESNRVLGGNMEGLLGIPIGGVALGK